MAVGTRQSAFRRSNCWRARCQHYVNNAFTLRYATAHYARCKQALCHILRPRLSLDLRFLIILLQTAFFTGARYPPSVPRLFAYTFRVR